MNHLQSNSDKIMRILLIFLKILYDKESFQMEAKAKIFQSLEESMRRSFNH